MTMAIVMTGLAPVSMADTAFADTAPAKTSASMPADCHEQMGDTGNGNEPASPCKMDAACAAMCIMHAFQVVSVAYTVPVFNRSVILPVLSENLTSTAHKPSFRPPIA